MELEIIDNLETNDPYNPLSARQGMLLKQMIDNVASNADIDAIFI